MNSTTPTATSSGLLPPISSPSSSRPAFGNFNSYVYDLFKAALNENKKLSHELLKDPTFGSSIVKHLPKGSKTPRIVLLNLLARQTLGKFQKQDIADLIYATGRSSYVASCASSDIQALYAELFSCPESNTFSQHRLLDFEYSASPPLQSYVFEKILNHPSFAGLSIVQINNLARTNFRHIPKPHIQHLVQVINKGESSLEDKVQSLCWSVFTYPESQFFSREELIALARKVNPQLRPYILKWILLHPSFETASRNTLSLLTLELEKSDCSEGLKIDFLSTLLQHRSLGLFEMNRPK